MKPSAECGSCISFVAESHATTLAEKARQSVICFLRWAGWGAEIDRQEGNDLFGAVIDET